MSGSDSTGGAGSNGGADKALLKPHLAAALDRPLDQPNALRSGMNMGSTLHDLTSRLRREFWRYEAAARPPENPVFDHDLGVLHGAQLIAARLGYKIFPGTLENIGERMSTSVCPEPNYAFIRASWDGENSSCPIAAALGPSQITVVEISDAEDDDALANLARLEDVFGPLPRTRIVKTHTGYQIHMRGATSAAAESLGKGLVLKSLYRCVLLPGPSLGEVPFRWLRVGDLGDAPDWVLDRRKRRLDPKGVSQ